MKKEVSTSLRKHSSQRTALRSTSHAVRRPGSDSLDGHFFTCRGIQTYQLRDEWWSDGSTVLAEVDASVRLRKGPEMARTLSPCPHIRALSGSWTMRSWNSLQYERNSEISALCVVL